MSAHKTAVLLIPNRNHNLTMMKSPHTQSDGQAEQTAPMQILLLSRGTTLQDPETTVATSRPP